MNGITAGRYVYDAFGNVDITDTEYQFPLRFTGQKLDPETGLYYYKARYYDPALGRFLQVDPIGYEDQMNLYAYVHNDPVNATDPTGEFGVVGALIDAAVGGAALYASQVIVDSKDGLQLSDFTSEAAVKAGATGALVGSGAGIVATAVGAAAIGAGVEVAANAATGEQLIGGDVAAAALNNTVAAAGGVGAGKVGEKAVGAVLTAGRNRAAARGVAMGQTSVSQAARTITSQGIDVSGTVTGEVAGHAAGSAATYALTDNAPSDIVQREYEKLQE